MFINYMYVDILLSLTKAFPIIFECVTTHFQILQTWIGPDATCYHTYYYTVPYIFSQFNMAVGHNKTCYHKLMCYHPCYFTFL